MALSRPILIPTTPDGQGAKQPGMTGMVKEEIITRLAELGLIIEQGKTEVPSGAFADSRELLTEPATFVVSGCRWFGTDN